MRDPETGPDTRRSGRGFWRVRAKRPVAAAAAVTALAGLLAGGPVQAQDSAAIIERRIEAVFKILPRNTLDLAVPLSRRALARRAEGEVAPLAYREVVADSLEAAAAPLFVADEAETEEGSADVAEDEMVRLPRPRPSEPAHQEAAATAGPAPTGATDLVASAAPPASADPTPPETKPVPAAVSGPGEVVVASLQTVAAPAAPPPAPASSADQPSPVQPAADLVLEPSGVASNAAEPAAELVAREDCLGPDEVADPDDDFSRNAEALRAPGICITQEKFRERRRPWTIQSVESGRPGPLWVVMHDDEDLAFDNAVQLLGALGGTFVTVDARGKRNQDGIDPNRNFSDEAVSCPKLGKSAAPRFTAAFKALLDAHRPIIALHNNHDGRVPTGGIGHVSMKTVPKDMKRYPSDDPDGALAGDRALVLLAAGGDDPALAARVKALNGKGINVVVESVTEGRGDCSLSNYAVLSGVGDYFNVTVDHDEAEKQRGIVEAILATFSTVSASR